MTQVEYFKTENSTVTIGSTDEKSRIISDIEISGAEKPTDEYRAIDGTNYPFVGKAGMATISFDYIQAADSYNITEMVYGAGTVAGSTQTLTWDGTATEKTITLSNVRSADNKTLTVTLTNVTGISAPIKYETSKGVVRTFNGIVAAENISEANDTSA